MVLTIEDGQIMQREMRDKLSHAHFANEKHAETPGQPHGFGPQEHDRHVRMAQAIADCEALLCRGMGAGAYYSMQQQGIRPVVTDIATIDEAAMAYARGDIVDYTDRLH